MALYISTDRLPGLLAHTMEEFDQAQSHFEDAVSFSRNAGYRPELVWSLCDYADMLLDRKRATDQSWRRTCSRNRCPYPLSWTWGR